MSFKVFSDLQAIRKLLETETGGLMCPSCQMPFDKGKKRKLIDNCGHERCYSCLFKNEECPVCIRQDLEDKREILSCNTRKLQDYDTSIGGSTTTISPLGSPQPPYRSSVKSNGYFSNYMQSRHELTSPEPESTSVTQNQRKIFHTKSQSGGLADITVHSCATPPQHRRRLFNPKSLRSPFGQRRPTNKTSFTENSSTLSGISSLNTSTHSDSVVTRRIRSKLSSNDTKSQHRLSLGSTSANVRSAPAQSCSSLASANTSPVSTLTGSSEADVSRVLQESNVYNNIGCDSIGSLMSVSISGNSNGSSSPLSRRHSVTTAQQGHIEDLAIFKNRKSLVRRSARSAQIKESLDPKIFTQYRPPQLTLKPLFFEVPLQEPDPLFIGRHWLLREISNAVSTTESAGILINGHLGTGKTALILQLVEYSCFGRRHNNFPQENDGIIRQVNVAQDRIRSLASQVVAYHFCQADNNSTCLVPDFIHSLAAQLCQAPQLSNYRDYILGEPNLQNILSVKECVANPERAMKMGILEPLVTLKRTGKISAKNCIILIDALCEAEYHRPDHGDTIASFLAKMTEYFPSWLRIIATIRTEMLEFVKGLPYTKMTLDSWSSNESLQKDILDYITFRMHHSAIIQKNTNAGRESGHPKFAQHLLGLCRGSFLFAKLSLDLIEGGYLVIKSSSYKVLPVSLAQIFLLHFNLKFPTTTAYDKVFNIINVCLAALYPLTMSEIFHSVNALQASDPMDWNEFVFRFKQLSGFLIKRIDNTYMFFHPSFREWLIRRDEGESTKFLCDLRMGHAGLAFKLSRIQAPLDAEQALELGHHILKAHIYRNAPNHQSPRDLQSYWITSVTNCISSALCTLRNVYSPNVKVSRLLLLAGASPDFVTNFLGKAPILCIAAHEGNVSMVKLLLEFGADVELANSQGCTPLILAASNGHCDVVRQLVAAGCSLGHTDTANRCALVHAARMNKITVVKYLIACDWLQRPNSNDVTLAEASQQALIAAASQGNTSIIEDLLDMDDLLINATDSLTGETALSSSSKSGHTETAAALISRGALVDGKNKKGLTPLLLAVKDGHWAVTERLLQNRADAEQVDSSGKTALIIAAEEGHVGIIDLLVNRGASLLAQDRDGLTALSWSCLRGRLQAAKCLAERNADIQHVDNTGRTPLDLAAYQGSAALVQMLLDKGVKIEHVDMNGMRPLDRAIACRNIQVVQVFLKRGAKLGPATWAMAAGKPEILLLLLNKLLEDGNILYRKNRLQDAAHRYQYALRKIPNHTIFAEHSSTFLQLKVNFLLNHSRCKRKMKEFTEATDLASLAIELRPDNYEGYYARAKAFMDLNNVEEALNDAREAINKSINTSVDIQQILLRLEQELYQRSITSNGQLIAQSTDTTTDLLFKTADITFYDKIVKPLSL
ncbi:Protein TANC2 [Pseudolycoriella hygida]|uniref:Protein TANC2 n=1 Tax=Pseudolycoriella hygida TaxID=35572 RepID=A0A9Q0RVT1_9DIPT|nr:Protein TANC2 [Pseudolycoriella hygida]